MRPIERKSKKGRVLDYQFTLSRLRFRRPYSRRRQARKLSHSGTIRPRPLLHHHSLRPRRPLLYRAKICRRRTPRQSPSTGFLSPNRHVGSVGRLWPRCHRHVDSQLCTMLASTDPVVGGGRKVLGWKDSRHVRTGYWR